MIAACKAANVKLMIAYRCHYEPTNLRAVKLIRDGALGQVQAIESAFGFNIAPGEWRLNKKLAGGGPLFDVGIYSLNACRYLTGEEPENIAAFASVIDHDGRFDAVEENVSWTMRFPSGVVAACNTTYGANMTGFFRVHGSKGMVEAQPAFNYDGLALSADLNGKTDRRAQPGQRPLPVHAAGRALLALHPRQPGAENAGRGRAARYAVHRGDLPVGGSYGLASSVHVGVFKIRLANFDDKICWRKLRRRRANLRLSSVCSFEFNIDLDVRTLLQNIAAGRDRL